MVFPWELWFGLAYGWKNAQSDPIPFFHWTKGWGIPWLTSEAETSPSPPSACPQPCPLQPFLLCPLHPAHPHPTQTPAAASLLIYLSILQFISSEIFLKASPVPPHVQDVMMVSGCTRSSSYPATFGPLDLKGEEIVYFVDPWQNNRYIQLTK